MMPMPKRHENIRRRALRVLVIHKPEAVELLWVFVDGLVGLNEPDRQLDDGALREVVAVAEGPAAGGHDLAAGEGGADGVEALGFVDEACGVLD
jgi:hypothetical protein